MNPNPQIAAIETLDHCVQAVMLIITFVHPWCARRGQGWRVFLYPLFISFFWAIWRIAIFDPSTSHEINDVPGLVYLAAGLLLGVMSVFLYGFRLVFSRLSSALNHPKAADPAGAGDR